MLRKSQIWLLLPQLRAPKVFPGSPRLKRKRFTSPQRWILFPPDYSLEREPFITRRWRASTVQTGRAVRIV